MEMKPIPLVKLVAIYGELARKQLETGRKEVYLFLDREWNVLRPTGSEVEPEPLDLREFAYVGTFHNHPKGDDS
jgi:hypothetical protein